MQCPAGLVAVGLDDGEAMIAEGDCTEVATDENVVLADAQACIRHGEGECGFYCVTNCARGHLCIGDGGPENGDGGCLACTDNADCGGCGVES